MSTWVVIIGGLGWLGASLLFGIWLGKKLKKVSEDEQPTEEYDDTNVIQFPTPWGKEKDVPDYLRNWSDRK